MPLPERGATVQTTVLQPGGENVPTVEAAVYPHPPYEGNPWSQWGQGVVLPDGRFISAIGDHLGADGNSYLFEYAPESHNLTLMTDVLSLTEHQPGSWGYGKVHAQMVPGPCGEVYFSTYWGTRDGLQFSDSYQGDLLFWIDPEFRSISRLGAPVPLFGIPSLAGSTDDGLLYGEAVDPSFEGNHGPFFAYDLDRGEVVFRDDNPAHTGFRNIAVGADGRAYYSIGGGALAVYDPEANEASQLPNLMPGAWLRASTSPDPDGVVYGITVEPDMLFALDPSGAIRTIGPVHGYTTSIALDPERKHVLYVPDAHGGAWAQGAPIISVDTETGEELVIARLNDLAESALGLRLGGTYNVAVDPARRIAYVGMMAGQVGAEDAFGEIVLFVVHLP